MRINLFGQRHGKTLGIPHNGWERRGRGGLVDSFRSLVAIPAYVARAQGWESAPFVVSIATFDFCGYLRLVPAVQRAIDRVVDLKRVDGLVTKLLWTESDFGAECSSLRYALSVPCSIALLLCRDGELAEALMTALARRFSLQLVREQS